MPISSPILITNLKHQLTASRQRLQQLWDAKGFTDPEVLAAGLEFDELLNQYQNLTPPPAKPKQ